MNICGFEKFSMVDYDSMISCTVFTMGCDFKCPFCHNSSLVIPNNHTLIIDKKEVFDYLQKRKGLVDAVCISGGEPCLQKGLEKFIISVKNMGYKVKLDTNGNSPKALQSLINQNLIDYVAMDIKNSLLRYGETIGVKAFDTSNVEQSVKILLENNVQYEFRTTLLAKYHTTQDIENIGQWVKGAQRYFLQHFNDCESCIVQGLDDIALVEANKFKNILEKYCGIVKLRGY